MLSFFLFSVLHLFPLFLGSNVLIMENQAGPYLDFLINLDSGNGMLPSLDLSPTESFKFDAWTLVDLGPAYL